MKLFRSFATLVFHIEAMYRLDFWMRFFGALVGMYAAYWLWTTLYAQQPQSFPVTLEQIVTYGILAMTMNSVFDRAADVHWYIRNKMRSGDIQMDLLRPLDFHAHMLLRSAGQVCYAGLVLGLPGIILGVLFLGLRPPASLADGLLFLLSLAPAYLVAFSLSFLLSMVSVYTVETGHIAWFYYSVIFILSGQFVPLWVFPPLLGQVIVLLPFQSIIGIPLSIYIGQLSIAEAGSSLALQVFWAAALLALSRLVWRKAHAKLTVQGG